MRIRRNKYGARRTEYRGQVYDSKAEADFAATLDLRKRAGEVAAWSRGKPQVLIVGKTRQRRVTYKPDFIVFYTAGAREAIDVKGCVPRDFRIKAILWEQRFPELPLRVVDKDGNEVWRLK